MSQEISERFIDLEEVFRSKSPKMANALPGFIFSYLRRVIHEDEINKFLYDNRNIQEFEFIQAIINQFQLIPESIGLSTELLEGRPIIVGNHPLGGLDGITLMHEVGKIRTDLVTTANDLLMNLPNLRGLFFGVNKHGSNAASIKAFDDVFASDNVILYFPAGLVSRKQKGGIKDLDWKPTFIKKAAKHHRDVVPVHVSGRNSNFFYNLARLRNRLGVKANIEMLYLVDEMFKLRDRHISMRFGKRIPWQTFDKRYKAHEWAALMREHIYELASSDNPQSIEFKYLTPE